MQAKRVIIFKKIDYLSLFLLITLAYLPINTLTTSLPLCIFTERIPNIRGCAK